MVVETTDGKGQTVTETTQGVGQTVPETTQGVGAQAVPGTTKGEGHEGCLWPASVSEVFGSRLLLFKVFPFFLVSF